jgi:hypothetical protein
MHLTQGSGPIFVAGAAGMLFSTLAFGLFWTGLVAILYGLLYSIRKMPGGHSGSLAGASMLFWACIIFSPGALVFGGVSMFLLELGCPKAGQAGAV